MTPIIIYKPGQKGGDVKFDRVKNDIELHLKQRKDTYLTLFIDFYGIRNDWPGYHDAIRQCNPKKKAAIIHNATRERIKQLYGNSAIDKRFIPYVSMHEFEALLFSEPKKIAEKLHVAQSEIDKIVEEFGEPENIDDSPHSAPSKRLELLSVRYKKTTTGITIAREIGLKKIRESCPIFNEWLTIVENLKGF